ncbi:MAG: toprim domain-containing protein [Candidatus Nitrosocosmicus sp.]
MNVENNQITLKNIDDFILSLNDESNRNSIVIVEGKKDVEALFYLGYSGNIKAYHHYRGTTNFVDHCAINYRKLILLLDSDAKGKIITRKILSQLNGKFIDLYYKKKLLNITGGRIKKIEEIKSFYMCISEK